MFTGIVRERGRVASMEEGTKGLRLEIDAPETSAALAVGDSVSVSGACLTATAVSNGTFSVTAVPETLSRTSLGRLAAGDEVNLETAARVGDPLGGHFVQGHVDAIGYVEDLRQEAEFHWLTVGFPAALAPLIVHKGSIAVDGISLTVAGVDDRRFDVQVIPFTWAHTNLRFAKVNDLVNLESDMIGKYVLRAMDVLKGK